MMAENHNLMRFFTPRHKAYIDALLERSLRYYGGRLTSLAVFGSYARGENRKTSDLDLLLVLREAPKPSARIAEFVDAVEMPTEALGQALYQQDGILCEPSPYILTEEEARTMQPIYYDLVEHHVIVADTADFLATVLAAARAWMQSVDARCVRRNNTNEWQTKRVGFPGGVRL